MTTATEETTTELIEYNIADAEINALSEKLMILKVSGVDDKDGYNKIVEYRKDIKSRISGIEATRKSLKETSLNYGRKVDAEAKRITTLLIPMRDHLLGQENIIKNEKERIKAEKQRLADERHQLQIEGLIEAGATLTLQGYVWGAKTLSENDLWNLSDDSYQLFIYEIQAWKKFEDDKKALADKAAKEEAEKQRLLAEENRLKQEELDKKLAEADEREAKQKADQKIIDDEKAALQKEKDDKAQAEKDKIKADELAEKQGKEIEEAKKKATKEAEEKAERDAKQKEQDKIKEEKKKVARLAKLERQKPDKEKVLAFAELVYSIVIPKVKSTECIDILIEADKMLANVKDFLIKECEKLNK